jgi:hypothetical protein
MILFCYIHLDARLTSETVLGVVVGITGGDVVMLNE